VGAPATKEPGRLPCLNSDNCTSGVTILGAPVLSSYARKRAFAVEVNLRKLFESAPIERFAFITMTFWDKPSPAEASARFHSYWTHVLSEDFEEYVKILEAHVDGTPHFHIAARTRGFDIRSGFNFGYFDEYCRINSRRDIKEWDKRKLRAAARSEYGELGRNVELRRLHAKVKVTGKKYGVGRTEIVPVKTNSEGVSKYMGKYLTKASVLNGDGRKNRIVTYSKGFPKGASARFNWNSTHAKLWRLKLERFAVSQGCFSMEDLKFKFGPRWAWRLRDAIMNQEGVFEVKDYSKVQEKVIVVLRETTPEAGKSVVQRGSAPECWARGKRWE
jgi:hypothetical protein